MQPTATQQWVTQVLALKGWTRKQLAGELGITHQALQQLIAGKRGLTDKTRREYDARLGVVSRVEIVVADSP